MKLNVYAVMMLAISGSILCNDDPFSEFPPLLKQLCEMKHKSGVRENGSRCDELAQVMRAGDIKKAQEARKMVKGITCYDLTNGWISEQEREAYKVLDHATVCALLAEWPIRDIGKKHNLPHEVIGATLVYCKDKIEGREVRLPNPVAAAARKDHCPGCADNTTFSWRLWGQK